MNRFFNYIRNIWQGEDEKPSLKAMAAIVLIYNFVENVNWAIHKWEASRSFEGLSLIMGIEAGLITALLGITAWSNMTAKKIDSDASSDSPIITVQRAETITSGTKAETVNAVKVDTVNTNTTNISKEPEDAK